MILMSAFSKFALVLAVLTLTFCTDRKPVGNAKATRAEHRTGTTWERSVKRRLEAGDCRGAQYLLESSPRGDPLWYELMSRARIECWRKRGSSADAAQALSVLDVGLHAFPRSSNLLLSKAYRYRELGDDNSALKLFRDAAAKAKANLASDDRAAQGSDYAVLEAATKAVEQSETSIRQSIFEQEILQALARGDCVNAIEHLNSIPTEARADQWFDLLFVAENACLTAGHKGEYREGAERALQNGLRKFPSSTRLIVHAAGWYDAAGDTAKAVEFYEQALRRPDLDSVFDGERRAVQRRLSSLQSRRK